MSARASRRAFWDGSLVRKGLTGREPVLLASRGAAGVGPGATGGFIAAGGGAAAGVTGGAAGSIPGPNWRGPVGRAPMPGTAGGGAIVTLGVAGGAGEVKGTAGGGTKAGGTVGRAGAWKLGRSGACGGEDGAMSGWAGLGAVISAAAVTGGGALGAATGAADSARWTGKRPAHTLQRARTPAGGTFRGSTR